MKRVITLGLLVILAFGTQGVFAQEMADLPEPVFFDTAAQKAPVLYKDAGFWLPDFDEVVYYLWNFDYASTDRADFYSIASLAAAASSDSAIPGSIRNNKYFIESVRLTNLAQAAFEDGDYDLSTQYSQQAVYQAQLSDEYVTLQLKIKAANDAIAAAKARLDWANSSAVNASSRYPTEYTNARNSYNDAIGYRGSERWDDAVDAANRVINALAYVTEAPPNQPPSQPQPGPTPLPAQYTVRPWAISKDCLWNIAGRPWAYGDPKQWKLLYNANKAKLPQPNNPDLIHPGMVLDIPSIKGETRSGMWDAGATYSPLR
ncbi:LysM peptidoglycan-binding domain-containing protein [Leadbettera azotonutricia]|uniref:Treponemal membrane protein B (Antigen TmpB) n=1 Tax=Leadbettera azotonutricia (strain ATCC BAA-888 / DSM 13862 / ZAS-9) TaxID=545695 RepID=F5YEQ6_LEAAZ|nr:membrane protein B [Leadbettera azotonutricia]AEF83421.1 treponemal membrane protein B (Antigen TmpB) [Leadbettera azotonutricia ZAS-9]